MDFFKIVLTKVTKQLSIIKNDCTGTPFSAMHFAKIDITRSSLVSRQCSVLAAMLVAKFNRICLICGAGADDGMIYLPPVAPAVPFHNDFSTS